MVVPIYVANATTCKVLEHPANAETWCFTYSFRAFLLTHWIYAVTCLSSIALILLVVIHIANRPQPNRHAVFFALFEDKFRRVFYSQSRESLSTVMMGVNSILRPNPERPTVLLLLAPSSARSTAIHFCHVLALLVLSAFRDTSNVHPLSLTINGSDYTAVVGYWRFYEELSRYMARHRVVIITEFECMHPQVASVICHLADDTYAPFPQSIVLVVVNIANRFNDEQLKRQQPVILADSFLKERWENNIDADTLSNLLGRMTGRSLLVEEEKQEVKAQHKL